MSTSSKCDALCSACARLSYSVPASRFLAVSAGLASHLSGCAGILNARFTLPPPAPFRALEAAVYEEAGHEEECQRQHVVRALMHIDLGMSEKAAQQVRGGGGG